MNFREPKAKPSSRSGALTVLLLSIAAAGLYGCAASVAPVAGDVAGSAIEKTGDVWRTGKTDAYEPVPLDDAVASVKKAAQDLELTPDRQEKHPDQLKLIYHDQRKQEITVTVVRRTGRLCEIHVDVGMLGVQGAGRAMMRQILADLPGANPTDKRALEDHAKAGD